MLAQHCLQKNGTGSSSKAMPQLEQSTGRTTCRTRRMTAVKFGILPRCSGTAHRLVTVGSMQRTRPHFYEFAPNCQERIALGRRKTRPPH